MTNQRAAGQKQIITLMDESFVHKIESGMAMAGYSDRSKFIRDAVFEKLKRLGIGCDYTLAMAPPRAGKGGATPGAGSARMRGLRPGANIHLNEAPPAYGGKGKRRK